MRRGYTVALWVAIQALSQQSVADGFGWCQFGLQGPTVVVQGKLAAGQSFAQPIAPGLVFQLEPGSGGWTVVVAEPGKSDDYAAVVHLPLRFDYTLDIQAWHFTEETGGPGRERNFA